MQNNDLFNKMHRAIADYVKAEGKDEPIILGFSMNELIKLWEQKQMEKLYE